VADAFIPNPENLPEVDHIDTNGLNNHVDNLRWVTHEGNLENDLTVEHIKKNTGYFKEIKDLKTGEIYKSRKEAAERCGVTEGTISNHLNNKVAKPRWVETGNRIKPD
jgi:hypothetical protein